MTRSHVSTVTYGSAVPSTARDLALLALVGAVGFVLGKLERLGFVAAENPAGSKAKKVFRVIDAGARDFGGAVARDLRTVHPNYASVLLGMAHWPVLERCAALSALKERSAAVARSEFYRYRHVRRPRRCLCSRLACRQSPLAQGAYVQ
jgi:hypothetical protein